MIDGRIAQEGEVVTVDRKAGKVYITTIDGEHHEARAPKFGVNSIAAACNHREPHLGIFAVKTPEELEGISYRAEKIRVASFHPMRSSLP